MSLINDALKRAKQAQQQGPTSAPPPQFRPAESAPRRSGAPFLLIILVVALLVGAGVLIGMSLQRSGASKAGTPVAQQPEQASPVANATPVVEPAQIIAPQKVEAPPAAAKATAVTNPSVASQKPPEGGTPNAAAQPAAAPAPTVQVQQAAVPVAPPKPLPRLQGIFYRPDRPTAVLDGKVVLVGGTLGEFRVVAIQRNSVVIVRSGHTNVLSLSE